MTTNAGIETGKSENHSDESELKGMNFWVPVFWLASFAAAVIILAYFDLSRQILSNEWKGTSPGILGGTIGVFAFVGSRIIDHNKLLLNDIGRGPPKREHISYLRARLVLGVPSGFVMSTVVAAFAPHVSLACLTAFGILGGFSCTILPTLAAAAETAAVKYVSGNKNASRSSNHTSRSSKESQAGRSRNQPIDQSGTVRERGANKGRGGEKNTSRRPAP